MNYKMFMFFGYCSLTSVDDLNKILESLGNNVPDKMLSQTLFTSQSKITEITGISNDDLAQLNAFWMKKFLIIRSNVNELIIENCNEIADMLIAKSSDHDEINLKISAVYHGTKLFADKLLVLLEKCTKIETYKGFFEDSVWVKIENDVQTDINKIPPSFGSIVEFLKNNWEEVFELSAEFILKEQNINRKHYGLNDIFSDKPEFKKKYNELKKELDLCEEKFYAFFRKDTINFIKNSNKSETFTEEEEERIVDKINTTERAFVENITKNEILPVDKRMKLQSDIEKLIPENIQNDVADLLKIENGDDEQSTNIPMIVLIVLLSIAGLILISSIGLWLYFRMKRKSLDNNPSEESPDI